ncbi:MAG: restriction endonuclease subunit S [Chloroflexi bacterium]|nr:restriction endonuclease subunit S [Chloroflexota bacterium]
MMKPYPAYKDSGFKWLGEIPSHWEAQRVKYLFQEVDERSKDGEETLLSVSQYTGVTVRNSDNHSRESESLEGYKVCRPDDFVSNIMLAWMGAFGVTSHHGIVSPAYCVYRLKGDHNPKYFDYLFHTPRYLAEFARNSTGIISSRWRFYTDDFFRIFSILPPREEQDAIVDFIERETAGINQFLANKRQLITLLEEQKQVVINTAMTQGLDSMPRANPPA